MNRIRTVCLGYMAVGLILSSGAWAQKRLPIGGSTVPPVSGQSTQNQSSSDYNRPAGPLAQTDDADVSVRGNMDALRASMANSERQKIITREAAQLLQMAAELQLKIAGNAPGMTQEEMVRQVDMIEKLARNVKDRMKGAR